LNAPLPAHDNKILFFPITRLDVTRLEFEQTFEFVVLKKTLGALREGEEY